MRSITLDNLPDGVYEKLRARAEMRPRTDGGNVIQLVGRESERRGRSEDALLRRARQLRGRTSFYLTEESRRAAVETGRS